MKFLLYVCFALKISLILAIKWQGNLNDFPTGWGVKKISNPNLLSIDKDPLNPNEKVIKIKHPKNSCSSSCGIPGGAGFDVNPIAKFNGNVSSFEFEVFFHNTFDFVKGGKLPGMFGGAKGCSGCNTNVDSRSNCFSARFMWGKEGNGYPYLYLPLNVNHETDFCNKVNHKSCKADCGLGFDEKKYFEKGKWTHIRQNIQLNTPGKNNGVLQVWVNGVKKVFYNKMNYRTKASLGINGFSVFPFFGGSESFKTKVETYTLYKNFKFSDY